MHKISKSSVQLAEAHGKQAQEHGKSIEACGKTLQQGNSSVQECGHLIEEYGKTVQEYAQQSLLNGQELGQDVSIETESYVEAVQAHVNATKAHIQANTLYTRLMQEKLKERTKRVTKELS